MRRRLRTCGTANNGVTGWLTAGATTTPTPGSRTASSEQYIADAITAGQLLRRLRLVRHRRQRPHPDHRRAARHGHRRRLRDGVHRSALRDACSAGPSIWGHQWSLSARRPASRHRPSTASRSATPATRPSASGTVASPMTTRAHKATIGIMSHEFGHDINWPDLYDTDHGRRRCGRVEPHGRRFVGSDRRCRPSPATRRRYPDAYSLYYQGWVTAPRPSPRTTSGIALHSAPQSCCSPPTRAAPTGSSTGTSGTGEFFLAENRQPHRLRPVDAGLRHRRLPGRRDGHGEQLGQQVHERPARPGDPGGQPRRADHRAPRPRRPG